MTKFTTDEQGRPLAIGWSGQGVWDIALTLIAGEKSGKLLDAPSGGGYLADQLAQRGFQVVGADIVRDLWQFPQYPFVCADMDTPLPFHEEAFDVVMHVGGIAHLENPAATLRDFHRILRPKGSLVITIENIFTLESRFRFLMNGTYRWYPHYQYHGEDKAALHLVNREPIRLTTLIFHLERSGFEVEEIRFGGKRGYQLMLPLGVFFRFLTNIHNSLRKGRSGKQTPPIVNSTEALLYRHVGIRARRKA